MPYAIRLINAPGKTPLADESDAVALTIAAVKNEINVGEYLEWFDVDAKRGFGDDRWTDDPAKALRFNTFADAAAAWKTQSRKRPFRDDGKPNLPLTAYSVTIEKLP